MKTRRSLKGATGCIALVVLAACAAPRREVVDASDRTERDRSLDSHRKPVPMLAFFAATPGMHVGEIGAGGGYTTELLARSVAPGGTVMAHDPTTWDGPGLTRAWEQRLSRSAMGNAKHVVRPWGDPFPPDLRDLDAVYSVAVYHDAVAEGGDVDAMNRAVFEALRPGGRYYVVDNSATAGSGARDAEPLHRIDEALVREQVQKAGFRLAGEDGFLRNPADPRDWNADSSVNKRHDQDRFALKFVKPG